MINLLQVQTELSCARAARVAVEKSGNEIEALVLDMHGTASLSPTKPTIRISSIGSIKAAGLMSAGAP
jgi:hypothetical protein